MENRQQAWKISIYVAIKTENQKTDSRIEKLLNIVQLKSVDRVIIYKVINLSTIGGIMHKKTLFLVLFLAMFASVFALEIKIDVSKDRSPISPYIYGTNQDIARDANITARRFGGNRTTGYNWENNASNAGNDWKHFSDNWLSENWGMPGDFDKPGALLKHFHQKSKNLNAYSIVTLPLAGYVARDKNGEVGLNDKAPSGRWAEVVFRKEGELSLNPNTWDDKVYLDEQVNFLIHTFGTADKGGVNAYALDNEPDLWASTHPRIHPNKVTVEEYISKSVSVSARVKELDPYAEIFGPASYGFNGFHKFQDAPDWYKQAWTHEWFLAYYLDRMKQASDAAGKRLLDVLAIHWYPEARGSAGRIVFNKENAAANSPARVQAPRSFWDKDYTESSWICDSGHCPLRLIPRVKEMIDKYNPGTKLAFTEYDFGGGSHISGGLAQADVLGVFGKHGVYLATYWMDEWGQFTYAGFRLFRNYDGNKSVFGDTSVRAENPDREKLSVYASVDSEKNSTHAVIINKSEEPVKGLKLSVRGGAGISSAEAWGFDAADSKITKRAGFENIKGNTVSVDMPALSAYHVVMK